MTPLRLQMIEDMKSAGLAPRTQTVYIDAVRRLAAHYRRSPDRLSEAEVRGYPMSEREAKEYIQPHPLDRPKPINPLKAENEQLRQVIECLKAEVRRLGGDPDSVIARAQERRENGGRRSKGRSSRKYGQNPEARV